MPIELTPFEEHLAALVLAINRADGPRVSDLLMHLFTQHAEEFIGFADLVDATYQQVEAQLTAMAAAEGN